VRAAVLALGLLLLLAAPAAATVPPRDCGNLRADGKRFGVKTHLLRCRAARRHAERWLETRKRPAGWRCMRPKGSRLKLSCTRGEKTLFVLRR
jgi:hypothetical protein